MVTETNGNIGEGKDHGKPETSEPPEPSRGTPEWLAWSRGRRSRLLAQEAARLRAGAGKPSPLTAASLAALLVDQADAFAKPTIGLSPPLTAGAALPAVAQAAAGVRVVNAKIWERDVHPIGLRADHESWLGLVRTRARARVQGDVLAPTLVRTAELLVWDERRRSSGFARVTFDQLAALAMVCRETVRKAIRWLEGRGLVDTLNVLSRATGRPRRAANLYIRRVDAAPIAPDAAPADVQAARLARLAPVFGMRATAWGLNVTHGRADRPREDDPAPA